MVKDWLITGGCGYIGTSLIKKIIELDSNSNIRVLDNLSVGKEDDLSEVCNFFRKNVSELGRCQGVELIVGDIRNSDDCIMASKDVEIIVHLAANTGVGPSVENPRLDMVTNVIGTFNMLEAARLNDIKSFIFASSGAPVGEVEPPIHEELAACPVSPYGASKLAGEGYCSAYFRTFGINTVSLRFGNVYGPRSKHKSSVIAKFIKQALSGESCEIYGDGNQTRDFVYIGDLINAILKASELKKGGEIFQIATSCERTISEVASLLKQQLKGYKIDMKVKNTEKRLGDVRRNYSDITKAREMLGWVASTEIESGIEKTIDYFISEASGRNLV